MKKKQAKKAQHSSTVNHFKTMYSFFYHKKLKFSNRKKGSTSGFKEIWLNRNPQQNSSLNKIYTLNFNQTLILNLHTHFCYKKVKYRGVTIQGTDG